MRRLGNLCAQAVILILTACASPEPPTSGASNDRGSSASRSGTAPALVSWVDQPPPGCAVGSSGPTLNPRNSITNARLSAVEALAADSLEIDIHSVAGLGPSGGFEVSAQALSGTLADARIVALWADTDPSQGVRSRLKQVFALACWPDASLSDLPDFDYPDWVLDPPTEEGEICAVGIAGPTWKPKDQVPSALRDARRALAAALESRVEKRIFDDGRGVARIQRQIDPSPAAIARAAEAEELSEEWMDEEAVGPLRLPGILYGLACISG